MNELQRLSYLDAIGVSSYVSRSQLAGAAPTRRLRPIAPPRSQATVSAPAAVGLGDLRSDLGTATRPSAERSPPTTASARAVEQSDVPVFSLVASLAGGWLWLEEVARGREPGEDYRQLQVSICQAMAWDTESVRLEIFSWPLNNSSQLDHGEAAARDGVSGFIQARLERYQPVGVILLGAPGDSWFDRDLLGGVRVIELPSLRQMLRQGALKRQAWQILKMLRGGDG